MQVEKEINLSKRAYRFAIKVIHFVDNIPKNISSQVIGRQLVRSATSIAANIIEAKSSSSKKEFILFYNHSLKSANESKYWLALLKDTGKAKRTDIEPLLNEVEEISKIIASSIITMKKR